MPADLAAELSHGLAWRSAEPEEGAKLKRILIEHHPDDAATRLVLQMPVDRDLLGLPTPKSLNASAPAMCAAPWCPGED